MRAVERWKLRLAQGDVAYRVEDHGEGDEHLYFADPNGLMLEIAARGDAGRALRLAQRAARPATLDR